MANRKSTRKYYFSAEGNTEAWYLKWLERLINESDEAAYRVSIDSQVNKDPLKRAKSLAITGKVEIYHLSDYESDDPMHAKQFKETMDKMKSAMSLGKSISYKFGYSNLTFDLWIILHKIDCYSSIAYRKNYISFINKAFGETFESMEEYKHEKNFWRCLGKMDLNDVKNAINRSEYITEQNERRGYTLNNYRGFQNYKENPSLAIWEAIKKILTDTEIMKQGQ